MKRAIIIGAGPAGLTAAYELLHRTDVLPLVFESSGDIGGISKTVNYKGNRIDLGGHRFFSKSDRVMEWWKKILPIQGGLSKDQRSLEMTYHKAKLQISLDNTGPDPEISDKVMLIRSRLSRIFYRRRFFTYPVSLSFETVMNLGLQRMVAILASYIVARLRPIRNEKSLEDFLINRFGKELYRTFFKDYTEKVWGIPCSQISADWGAQRIKGLSISKAIAHAIKALFTRSKDLRQKSTETSLIEHFLYPKFGPGQMWEEVARIITEKGGNVFLRHQVVKIHQNENRIVGVDVLDTSSGKIESHKADFFFSTMAVKDLVHGLDGNVPSEVRRVAEGLMYRDFITVGLLLKRLTIKNETKIPTVNDLVPDNWIYIQEHDVRVGRLQIFNNWSPYMVSDPEKVWIGMEYFCNEADDLWQMPDEQVKTLAIGELSKLGIIDKSDYVDGTVLRMPKTYPAYFGTYSEFDKVRNYVDGFESLFLIGRNGMHRYNNQDHSMLTAMIAVDNILNNIKGKENIWAVNTEEEYHEEK